MRAIGDRPQRDVRGAHLISPALGLVALLLGAFTAHLNQTPAFLVLCASAAVLASGFLAYSLVKLYRQRHRDRTAP